MNKHKLLLSLFLLLTFIPYLNAESLINGNLETRIDWINGKFNFYSDNDETDLSIPLLSETSPISSYWVVIQDDNTVFSPQSSNLQNVEIHKTDTGVSATYYYSKLQVRTDLVAAEDRENTFYFDIEVVNQDRDFHSYRICQIWDTYLNEPDEGFLFSNGEIVNYESSWGFDTIPVWLGTPSTGNQGFFQVFRADTVTVPQRIILINWRKLHKNPISPIVNTGNPFYRFPDMTIDAALGVNYLLGSLDRQGRKKIRMMLTSNVVDIDIEETDSDSVNISDIDKEKTMYSLMLNIQLLDDFIKDIDSTLESEDSLLDEDLINFYNRLNELKDLQLEYEELQ